MCAVFGEFGRVMIRERVVADLQRAKPEGKHLVRPTNRRAETRIRILTKTGSGIHATAKVVGYGASVVQRGLKATAWVAPRISQLRLNGRTGAQLASSVG